MTTGELFNISTLDPLLPTFLIATLCLCALSVITYHSLALAWEVFWASRRSPSLLDPSAEVVLTLTYVLQDWYGLEKNVLLFQECGESSCRPGNTTCTCWPV